MSGLGAATGRTSPRTTIAYGRGPALACVQQGQHSLVQRSSHLQKPCNGSTARRKAASLPACRSWKQDSRRSCRSHFACIVEALNTHSTDDAKEQHLKRIRGRVCRHRNRRQQAIVQTRTKAWKEHGQRLSYRYHSSGVAEAEKHISRATQYMNATKQ